MAIQKAKLLICSPKTDFLKTYLALFDKEYEVQIAATDKTCEFLFEEWEPDVCLFDIDHFPQTSIFKIGRMTQSLVIGLFVFSLQKNSYKEEQAFENGADYFLCLPLEHKKINLRIRSFLRRKGMIAPLTIKLVDKNANSESPYIEFGDLKIFPTDFVIRRDGDLIVTTPTQFKLLMAFLNNKEQLLSRDWIKKQVWTGSEISPRSIDAQISKLKKIVPELDRCLVNVYGKGYILSPEKSTSAA